MTPTPLKPVNYDDGQHANYRAARDLGPGNRALWAAALSAHAPEHRPLDVLDLGCGTGRYTLTLAETFGGRTWGVEPSEKMRAVAGSGSAHPQVEYLEGRAERIPLPDDACDLVLMFLSFHHVRDRAAAAREIRRVLKPGGRVMIRSPFNDRMPDVHWHRFFPRARDIELAMFPSTTEVRDVFAAVGLQMIALDTVREQFGHSLADTAQRLRSRSISTFEHLSEAEIEAGFARLDRDVAASVTDEPNFGDSDLMVFA
ncbi:class I SAM-dependent methyltransferase [uncultured Brevundimonas sp.]|uniref:class I SAM-dependent methyltransferase n=1 Tax=uncultured Brevundimonas sp. TaxID=213418 RepID=UPI0030ECE371|tara:strand:- start:48923 stop:49693 length:771 start_codon:yes stop_codon:yes gene_type:complete